MQECTQYRNRILTTISAQIKKEEQRLRRQEATQVPGELENDEDLLEMMIVMKTAMRMTMTDGQRSGNCSL